MFPILILESESGPELRKLKKGMGQMKISGKKHLLQH